MPFPAYTFTRLLWVLGAVIAAAGMQVYIIWGSVRRARSRITIPSDLSFRPYLTTAGRRTTLNIFFPDPSNSSHLYTPRMQYSLVCLIFQTQFPSLRIDLAYGAGNVVVFAEYTLASFGSTPSPSHAIFSSVRLVALVCLTGVLLLHGLHIRAGIRLQNVLGFMKIGILLIVVGTGFIAHTGNLQKGVPPPGNFDSWKQIWAGSTTGGSALCTCLYNVRLYYFKQFNPTMDFHRSCTALAASAMLTTPSPKSTILSERFG